MDTVHVMDYPEKTQDYLKCIWDIVERTGEPASLSAIAGALAQKIPTASEAVKRLAARGLVEHQRYAGVVLTSAGRQVALAMVRRHRLIEMFLVRVLDYSWDEVHDEADLLEHAVSDQFLRRVDEKLGHPTRDPHGDPIPDESGNVAELPKQSLNAIAPGEQVVVEQIHDGDSELLRYLAENSITPGAVLAVVRPPVAGLVQVQVQDEQSEDQEVVPISVSSAADIRVSHAED